MKRKNTSAPKNPTKKISIKPCLFIISILAIAGNITSANAQSYSNDIDTVSFCTAIETLLNKTQDDSLTQLIDQDDLKLSGWVQGMNSDDTTVIYNWVMGNFVVPGSFAGIVEDYHGHRAYDVVMDTSRSKATAINKLNGLKQILDYCYQCKFIMDEKANPNHIKYIYGRTKDVDTGDLEEKIVLSAFLSPNIHKYMVTIEVWVPVHR
jgi:hypothetical protein